MYCDTLNVTGGHLAVPGDVLKGGWFFDINENGITVLSHVTAAACCELADRTHYDITDNQIAAVITSAESES